MKKLRILLILSLTFALILPGCQSKKSVFRSADDRFQDYCDTFVKDSLTNDPISTQYLLKNTGSYQSANAGLNSFSMTALFSQTQSLSAELARIDQFPVKQLSQVHQTDYLILKDYLNTQKDLSKYYDFFEYFSPSQGENAKLPILLSEYRLETSEDVTRYFKLLRSIPSYFDQLMEFEKYKTQKGTFMNDSALKKTVSQCMEFVRSGKDNILISSFQSRLKNAAFLNGKNTQITTYINENEEIISKIVLPAYQKLAQNLSSLSSYATSPAGLAQLPNGKAYYECLVRSYTGSNVPVPSLIGRVTRNLHAYIRSALLLKRSSSSGVPQNVTSPEHILSTLASLTSKDFPVPKDLHCTVKTVDASIAANTSPAYYLTPPADAWKENIIYVNPLYTPVASASSSNEDLLPSAIRLITTLAHEGYPGHLLQTTSYYQTNPSLLRHLLSYGGYTEGWATYCEYYSYSYLKYFGISNTDSDLACLNAKYSLALSCLADMLVNYKGYTLNQLTDFLKNYGISTIDECSRLYDYVTTEPGIYLKYYIGYTEFENLKQSFQQKKGKDFSLYDFHKQILKAGPCSFELLAGMLK